MSMSLDVGDYDTERQGDHVGTNQKEKISNSSEMITAT